MKGGERNREEGGRNVRPTIHPFPPCSRMDRQKKGGRIEERNIDLGCGVSRMVPQGNLFEHEETTTWDPGCGRERRIYERKNQTYLKVAC